MQFEKNVVEQFLWESYNLDSRKHLFKLINEADEETRKEIGKHRLLLGLFLLRRGKDPGFAFHIYNRIKKDTKVLTKTKIYIQKLLLDGSYYDENQLFNPCSSSITPNKSRSVVDRDLKHTYNILYSFEESLQYFDQRYIIALENKDDLTADAIRDTIREYKTHHYTPDSFSKKQKFYWDSDIGEKEIPDLVRYLAENIRNHNLYDPKSISELELTVGILRIGFSEEFIKILHYYEMETIVNSDEDTSFLRYNKFLTDVFSIISTIWFCSLSLKEKEQLLNDLYPFNRKKIIDYISLLHEKDQNNISLDILAVKMYSTGFLDIAESIYSYLLDHSEQKHDKVKYSSKLGDIYREKMEYEKAHEIYKQALDLCSQLLVEIRMGKLKSCQLNDYENPHFVSQILPLRLAEMELFLGREEAEKNFEEAKDRIEKTKQLEKISLMWDLACTYKRTGQFNEEYDCLDGLASIGKGKREDLVNKADERLTQINEYILESGELDGQKLDEKEQNDKWKKLVSTAATLRNSFQFEREVNYLNTALKIKENDEIKLNIAISKYNQGLLTESKAHFESLISSSDIDIVSKSFIYLSLIDFHQNRDHIGIDTIKNAFIPHIAILADIKLGEIDSRDFSQEMVDFVTGFIKNDVMERLQLVMELSITNLILLKKRKILKQVLDYILGASARMCSPDVHYHVIYITTSFLFSRGLTEEALDYSKISIEQLRTEEKYKIHMMGHTAQLYSNLCQYDQSINYLRDALQINPEYPDLWKSLGFNYEQLLDFKSAEECIDKAIELKPDDSDLNKLKERYNRLKKDTINFNDIKDEEVKRFFMSAERLVLDLSKSVKENEFDFTMALVSYGKGLESLMHKEISLPLRKKIQRKYGAHISGEYFNDLPFTLKNILGIKERTIPLGSWQYILDDCKNDNKNPIIKEARDYFAGKLNKNKIIIFDSCRTVSDYRNGSAHYTSKTMDEIMEDRKKIVEQINNVIGAFNSQQFKSL